MLHANLLSFACEFRINIEDNLNNALNMVYHIEPYKERIDLNKYHN